MSTASSPAQSARRQSVLARHPLVFYFLIAFVFSWLTFLPGPLTYYGVPSLSPQLLGYLAIAGLLGPVLSGFVMSAATEGAAGVGDLLRRIVRWRVGIWWYPFALLGVPAVMVLATIVLRPGALASFDLSAQPFSLNYLIAFVSIALIGDPCSKSPDGQASRSPACSGCTAPSLGASSWVACGRCGTCRGS
jgi:uncharacterized protein